MRQIDQPECGGNARRVPAVCSRAHAVVYDDAHVDSRLGQVGRV